MPNSRRIELLKEKKRRLSARRSLIAFSQAIEIPGKPATEDPDEWMFKPVESTVAEHHKLIMEALQDVAEGRKQNVMLFMPPGAAKSTYASVVFPAWYLGKYPGKQILLASYGSDLAKKHGRRTRQITRSKLYQPIFNTTLSKETSAANEWALENGSEYMANGLMGGLTGNRADGGIIDDPVKGRQEADSEAIQKSTIEAYEDDFNTRIKPGGWRVLIQTRWNENDLAGHILPEDWNGESGDIECRDGRTWHVICLQAQCTRKDDPLGRKQGEYIWPEWFGDGFFEPFKQNPRSWNSLFQQVPTAEEGIQFKREWFNWYDRAPKHLNIYMSGDFAVTDDGGDFTELATWGVCPQGNVYCLDWWYGQTNAETWVNELTDRFKADKPLWFAGEMGPIRRAVEPYLKKAMSEKKAYCTLDWLPTMANNKVAGARSFEALCSSGKVYFPVKPWAERVVDQLLRFPAGRYDDAVDTCTLFGRKLFNVWDAYEPKTIDKTLKQPDPGLAVAELFEPM